MSKKHYVIWKGKQTGIFDTWSKVQSLVSGLNNAQYMGFPSKEAAEAAFKDTYTKALMKRSLTKNTSDKKSKEKSKVTTSKTKTLNFADYNIYCDGACSPNPGKSGSGVAIYNKEQVVELWYGLHDKKGTNNTAELLALYEALKFAEKYIEQRLSVQILSDSKYSIDCITKWAIGWQKKGWTRGKGEEIKNLEVIKNCFALYQRHKTNIVISHVKGHANIEGNELSDRMAVLARIEAESNFIKFEKAIDIPTILEMASG